MALKISEKSFEAQVKELADRFLWLYYHTHRSEHSPAGFPDCVMVRERVIYAELKTEKGQPSAEEYEWLLWLIEAGQEVYLWRPSDFYEIAGLLR